MLYKQLQFTTGWFGKLMFKFDSKIDIRFDDELGIVPISSINVSLLAGTDVNNQVLNRIKELLNKFYEETKKIITEHKDMVTEMAEKLLEQKSLDEKEAYEIYDKYQSK